MSKSSTRHRQRRALKPIHVNIRARRKWLDLTQEELGRRCDVDKTVVSHWERGVSSPRGERIVLVAEALKTTIDKLFAEAG